MKTLVRIHNNDFVITKDKVQTLRNVLNWCDHDVDPETIPNVVRKESSYITYGDVKIGIGAKIDDNVIIGYPAKDTLDVMTVIGDNAVLRSGTVIYAGSVIGENFQTGHNALVRENCHIGNTVVVGSGSVVDYEAVIGDNVRIHSNITIGAYSKLEHDCFLASNVVLSNVPHPKCPKAEDCAKLVAPRIRAFAKIGVGVTILPDVVIGEWALVGGGSVVTKSVEEKMVVAGNPARVINDITRLHCQHGWLHNPYGYSDNEL